MKMNWNSCGYSVSGVGKIPTIECIFQLIQVAISWLLIFSSIVALFFIIYAGIKFITSSGDAKQIEGARKTFGFAILGLILVFLSFLILNIIAYITGVDQIKEIGF